MLYPKHLGEEGKKLVDMLNTSCEKGNSSVLFSGYESGFIGDAVGSLLASISMDVTSVRTYELVDWGNYDKHDTLAALGIGGIPGGPERPIVMEALRAGWSSSINELADMMNIEIDEIVTWDKPAIAEETFTAKGGMVIEKGTVAVNRWAIEGLKDGVPVLAIEHCN